jgi:hypothetical protein
MRSLHVKQNPSSVTVESLHLTTGNAGLSWERGRGEGRGKGEGRGRGDNDGQGRLGRQATLLRAALCSSSPGRARGPGPHRIMPGRSPRGPVPGAGASADTGSKGPGPRLVRTSESHPGHRGSYPTASPSRGLARAMPHGPGAERPGRRGRRREGAGIPNPPGTARVRPPAAEPARSRPAAALIPRARAGPAGGGFFKFAAATRARAIRAP